jgi:hypothetical protein
VAHNFNVADPLTSETDKKSNRSASDASSAGVSESVRRSGVPRLIVSASTDSPVEKTRDSLLITYSSIHQKH